MRWKETLLRLGCLFCLSLCLNSGSAQVFTGMNGSIQDNMQSEFTINVSSLNSSPLRSSYGLSSVEITIQHDFLQDLSIALMAPDGSVCRLVSEQGANTNHYTQTVFTDNATLDIQSAGITQSPYTGTYKPDQVLGNLNNFQSGLGTWRLIIQDHNSGNTGSLIDWKLHFGTNVHGMTDTFSSDIPVLVLQTINQSTNHDSQIVGSIKVIDHQGNNRNGMSDSVFTFFGKVHIKDHGQQSINFPQRSYVWSCWIPRYTIPQLPS